MKILFLGDVVGVSGCSKILNNLKSEIEKKISNILPPLGRFNEIIYGMHDIRGKERKKK